MSHMDDWRELQEEIVKRLDAQLPLLLEVHEASCEEPNGPSPLLDAMREMTEAIERQTEELQLRLLHSRALAEQLDEIDRKLDGLLKLRDNDRED